MARRRADQPRDPAAGEATRYGRRSGSGANEPPHGERKEERPAWRPRQGPMGGEHPAEPSDGGTPPG